VLALCRVAAPAAAALATEERVEATGADGALNVTRCDHNRARRVRINVHRQTSPLVVHCPRRSDLVLALAIALPYPRRSCSSALDSSARDGGSVAHNALG